MSALLAGLLFAAAQEKRAEEFRPGLVGEYFYIGEALRDFPEIKRKPDFKRVDRRIDFDPTSGAFRGTELKDAFFIRWTGILRVPREGRYVFFVASDDGSRLFINGKLVVNNGGNHAWAEEKGAVELKAGDHDFRLEFFEGDGDAGCVALWQSAAFPREVIPPGVFFHKKSAAPTEEEARDIDRNFEKARKEPEERVVTGEVLKASDEKVTLAVAKDSQTREETFKIVDKTKVLIDGEKADGDDLKKGWAVRVVARENVAVLVESSKSRERKEKAEQKKVERPSFPVDERIVPKGTAPPDLGGKLVSAYDDGPLTLLTFRIGSKEYQVYVPREAEVSYVGILREGRAPTPGYLVYIWLKPGSEDTAARVTFGLEKSR